MDIISGDSIRKGKGGRGHGCIFSTVNALPLSISPQTYTIYRSNASNKFLPQIIVLAPRLPPPPPHFKTLAAPLSIVQNSCKSFSISPMVTLWRHWQLSRCETVKYVTIACIFIITLIDISLTFDFQGTCKTLFISSVITIKI